MKKKYRWSSIILLLIISLILIIGISNGISLDIDSLRDYIDSSKYSEIIFIAIWCIRLISFIPGVTLIILGGLIFEAEEAIILSAIGARCGKCFFAIGKWTAIKNTITIKTDKEKVISKFAFYLVNNENFWEKSGSAQPFIKLSSVKNTKIPLPPLEIQKQIVAECEKVEEQYNTIRMSIEKYRELIKAILVKCGIVNSSEGGGRN